MTRAQKATSSTYFNEDNGDGTVAPTWIMGVSYTELHEEERRSDVFSKMWLTYRSGFPRMEPYAYTDDSGWGCMLRSAQMLMSQALLRHSLGRAWRIPRTLEQRLRVPEYRRLIELFADQSGEESLFSIHNMCQVGIRYDKLPGEWYGPTTAACVLRDIAQLYADKPIPSPPLFRRTSTSPRCPPALPSETILSKTENTSATTSGVAVQVERNGPSFSADAGRPMAASHAGSSGGEGKDGRRLTEDTQWSKSSAWSQGRRRGQESNYSPRDSEQGGVEPSETGKERPDSSPSDLRPVRVFVSQGGVVYNDEVETMALRGRSVSMGVGKDQHVSVKQKNNDGPAENERKNVVPMDTEDGKMSDKQDVVDCGSRRGDGEGPENSKEASSKQSFPNFYDPLLNPGGDGNSNRDKEEWASAIVLLVPLRLGLDELSPAYIPGLLGMLQVPQSVGFLGGRPNHATFWIGVQGETLTGLDPHTTQAAPEMGNGFPSERYMHSLHCHHPVSMDVRRIDPSLALAFYLSDRKSFEDLVRRVRQTTPPLFSVEQTRPDFEGEMGLAFMINQRDDDGITDNEEDEYVFVKGPER